MRPFPIQLTLTDHDFSRLGRLVSHCALLEFVISNKVCNARPDERSKLERLPAEKKIVEARKLLAGMKPEAAALVGRALDAVTKLLPLRNDLIHGAWMIHAATGDGVAVNPRTGRSVREIDRVEEAIGIATEAAYDLLTGLAEDVGAGFLTYPLPLYHDPDQLLGPKYRPPRPLQE